MDICLLIATGAPLTERLPDIARTLTQQGWDVRAVATPAATQWIDPEAVSVATGRQLRTEFRDGTSSKEPRPHAIVIAPATFNTVNKLATGITDTYAHAVACEGIGDQIPVVVVPMINTSLWGHPARAQNFRTLEHAGVQFIDIQDGSPEPRPVHSGTGAAVVAQFDPRWIVAALRRSTRN